MRHSERVPDLHLTSILRADSKKRTNDPVLVDIPAQGVVEDGEDGLILGVREQSRQPLTAVVAYLGLDGDVQRGSRRLGAHGGRAEWAREMEEGVILGHGDGDGGAWAWVVVLRRSEDVKCAWWGTRSIL